MFETKVHVIVKRILAIYSHIGDLICISGGLGIGKFTYSIDKKMENSKTKTEKSQIAHSPVRPLFGVQATESCQRGLLRQVFLTFW